MFWWSTNWAYEVIAPSFVRCGTATRGSTSIQSLKMKPKSHEENQLKVCVLCLGKKNNLQNVSETVLDRIKIYSPGHSTKKLVLSEENMCSMLLSNIQTRFTWKDKFKYDAASLPIRSTDFHKKYVSMPMRSLCSGSCNATEFEQPSRTAQKERKTGCYRKCKENNELLKLFHRNL